MYADLLVSAPAPIGSAQSLASAAVVAQHIFSNGAVIRKIGFKLATAVVSTGNVVVTFKKRPIPGSSSGESSIGTITIPNGAAAGAYYAKMLSSPVQLAEGQVLSIEVTTAAAGMGAAGDGYAVFSGDVVPEYLPNVTSYVAG